ncbi:MAG: UDP-glucose 4-epimerase GalE [Eubacteriales bacterium]|nr:UDP-glucose 4-epimerase GalE [Eubacteriales bacterium]MDD4582676.1 UDP-glucose 4-epimerase GalE [Eubacteriales bacterium]
MAILVTGGAGYIGSHTCVELLTSGKEIVVIDNLSNSKEQSLSRVKQITEKNFPFYPYDLCKEEDLKKVFTQHEIESTIHFAGFKAVGESVDFPLRYYDNNLRSTLNLLKVMDSFGVKNLVFSSSATVYGNPHTVPITEDFPLAATNPYGATKLMIEQILKDLFHADPAWNISILRYFNPIGAHESGLIGENPNGIPNNLVPFITQVAIGKIDSLKVFGNNYPTKDGTGVRDYIHVVDLAKGHLAALTTLGKKGGLMVHNLGTGTGYSVLEIVDAFRKVTGNKIPYTIVSRRPGDIATCYANPKKAEKDLGWRAEKGLEAMCCDSWRWQTKNPNGYE